MLSHLFGCRPADLDLDRAPDRRRHVSGLGVEQLETRDNPVALYVVPGAASTATALDFSWIDRKAAFFNEIGVYRVDDASGAVNGVAPGAADYAQAALAGATTVFARGQTKGARSVQTFAAGTVLGFYLVQNNTTAAARAANPANAPVNGLSTFFSFAGASPDGFDHTRAAASGTQTTVRFEDGLRGGDRDFDDAVIRVRTINPNIAPGATGQVTPASFRLNQREAAFRSEVGVYAFDDASGAVGGVRPGDPGYAAAVLRSASRTALFAPNAGAGTVAGANLPGGSNFGFYLIQGADAATLLQVNPTNTAAGAPVMFFSQPNANPDSFVHVRQDGNTVRFEDTLNGGDQDFDDAVISFVFGAPVGTPATPPVSPPASPPPPPPADTTSPVVTAALVTDTADPNRTATASDNVTSVLGITGTATDADGIAALDARLGASGAFTSILPSLSGTTFTLTAAQLQALNGGVALTPGTYTLQVRATDTKGNTSDPISFTFTFDTATAATLLLDAGSDTGAQGEFRTETASVTLRGTAEAGATVRLESRAVGSNGSPLAVTTADASGVFTFTGQSLAAGPNGFKVFVTDAAGNTASSGATITRNQAPTASATPTPVAGTQNTTGAPIDLSTIFADADTNPYVRFTTNLLDAQNQPRTFDVQLFSSATPGNAANFQAYANTGKYDSSFIHRALPNFVVQGGGFRTVSTAVATAAWAGGVATVDTAAAHGLTTGQRVVIAGVTPAGYNGTFTVTVVDADTFTYALAADPGGPGTGGTVTSSNFVAVGGQLDVASASWLGGTVTVDTTAAHGLTTGQRVVIAGVTPAGYNGEYAVTVVDADTFTYALAADPGGPGTGGTVTKNVTNEPGLPNSRGTLAFAKVGEPPVPDNSPFTGPDSATNQFFVSLADNTSNLDGQNGGFTVFGQVAGGGQAVVDAIAAVQTFNYSAAVGGSGAFDTIPVQNNNPAAPNFREIGPDQLVRFTDVSVVGNPLTYAVTGNTNTAVVTNATISNGQLTLQYGAAGTSTVTVTAADPDGATVTHQFVVTVP